MAGEVSRSDFGEYYFPDSSLPAPYTQGREEFTRTLLCAPPTLGRCRHPLFGIHLLPVRPLRAYLLPLTGFPPEYVAASRYDVEGSGKAG